MRSASQRTDRYHARIVQRRRSMKVFGIVGRKNSGKTHLVTRLVRLASRRGLRVSTIKHAHHSFDIDRPGKDSHLHREAGAHEVLVASAERWALMHEHRGAPEPSLVGTAVEAGALRPGAGRGFQARSEPAARGVPRQLRAGAAGFRGPGHPGGGDRRRRDFCRHAAICRACRSMTTRRCWTTCSRGPELLPQSRRPAHRARGS